jgi:hypothetical protein
MALDNIGQGTLLERMEGSSYVAIPNIKTLNLPEISRTQIESTDLQSTDKEFFGGMRDNGSIAITQKWTDANYADWVSVDDGKPRTYRITVTGISEGDDAVTPKVFDAVLMKLSQPIEMDAQLMTAVELKVTGAVTDGE